MTYDEQYKNSSTNSQSENCADYSSSAQSERKRASLRGEPIRVVLVGKSNRFRSPGGGEIQLQSTAKALTSLGVQVVFGEMSEENSSSVATANASVTSSAPTYPIPSLPMAEAIRDAHAVHFFGSQPEFYPWVKRARRMGIPTFLSTIAWFSVAARLREPSPGWLNLLKAGALLWRGFCPAWPSWRRRLYRQCDLLLPNSQVEAEQLTRYFRIAKERIHIVPNGAEERFGFADPVTFMRRYGLGDFILYAGRIEPRKNQLGFLRAMRGSGLDIVVLGDVVPGHEWYARECRREADSNVHFLERIEHSDPSLAGAYAASKCLVLAGDFETPGLSAIEAAMIGTPLVLPAVGAAKEYFGDLATYVYPDDLRGIRQAVLRAYHSQRNEALAELARENYSWRSAAEATLTAYRRVLTSKGNRAKPHKT